LYLLVNRIHAEENKRRTLQRSDIAAAISKTDMFDFLIDIVPREEFKAAKEAKESSASGHGKSASGGGGIEHRHSQESFPPMGGVGGPAAAGGGSGGPIGLEGYGYPYGMIANGQFSMVRKDMVSSCGWTCVLWNGLGSLSLSLSLLDNMNPL
jgi:uncharacterized membrane protein